MSKLVNKIWEWLKKTFPPCSKCGAIGHDPETGCPVDSHKTNK